jgi:hypothetical protein
VNRGLSHFLTFSLSPFLTFSLLKWLRHEERAACSVCVHRLRESGRAIDPSGLAVVLSHFQRELAATQVSRLPFDGLQQPPAGSLPAMCRQHRQVMNVDERPGRERREPPEADRDPDGALLPIGKEDQGRRNPPQPGYQLESSLRRKRSAIAHRIHGIGMNQLDDSILMIGAVEIGLDDFNRGHTWA